MKRKSGSKLEEAQGLEICQEDKLYGSGTVRKANQTQMGRSRLPIPKRKTSTTISGTMATLTSTRTDNAKSRPNTSSKRKKDQPRTEIWSNLLRQTREAQARSTHRASTQQNRHLLLLGGKPEDQHNFVSRHIARPPPPAPPGRKDGGKERRPKGEVRLSNKFAYGYGYVNLFSPPTQGASAAMLGSEAEEAAKVECHCFPGEPEKGFEAMLRRILHTKKVRQASAGEEEGNEMVEDEGNKGEQGDLPSVAILLSWHQPWGFLATLRTWFLLLARALLSEQARKDENPLEVIKEYGLNITVVLQHVEAQEELEREGYKDDTFDYISQALRTCLLPLSAGLIYTPTNPAPTQPGGPLTEAQKLIYTSLALDVTTLQTRRPGSAGAGAQAKKEDLAPRHNVVDRMAILVPGGWDSVGKIRLLSETFSPESMLEGWISDLDKAVVQFNRAPAPAVIENGTNQQDDSTQEGADPNILQANGTSAPSATTELYSSQPSPTLEALPNDPPMSPSKLPKSAISPYEETITNPHAHKIHSPPRTEVTVKPEQEFLAEMRAHLQRLEAQDKERERRDPSSVHTTYNSVSSSSNNDSANVSKGPALEELGDVSFNVGGVSYNTVSAEAAIERLKRPNAPGTPTTGGAEAGSRTGTPRPRREEREESSSGSGAKLETDKLEEYFASLMKRGAGGAASREGTPSK